MDQPATSSAQGARAAAGQLAHHVIGRNPKIWGIIFIAMAVVLLIFIVLFIVYFNKYKECGSGGKSGMLGTNPLGNLNTGGNNPLWHYQMGDAGWGGPMHSTHQQGQPRVWGASAESDHDMGVVSQSIRGCGGSVSPAAVGEAQALTAAQAFEPAGSAKNMSDDDLMRVMNGGA
jgi:hypothetical protein